MTEPNETLLVIGSPIGVWRLDGTPEACSGPLIICRCSEPEEWNFDCDDEERCE